MVVPFERGAVALVMEDDAEARIESDQRASIERRRLRLEGVHIAQGAGVIEHPLSAGGMGTVYAPGQSGSPWNSTPP